MYCGRCCKEVEVNDYCKSCDDKLSTVYEKKMIKKYDIKTVAEWIHITKDSIHSMTSKKMVVDDSSIDNQDVIVVKDVDKNKDVKSVKGINIVEVANEENM